MPNRRNQTPSLDILEDTAGPMPVDATPPPGVPVQHKHEARWLSQTDPASVPAQARGFSDELRALAGEETPETLILDPLSEFCEAWRDYTGHQLTVVRHSDPATRRTPGQAYNRPAFELEVLGNIPFDPNNLVYDLQMINGNSGGVFRLTLRDQNGYIIPEARLERIVIPDPPRDYSQNRRRQFNDDGYGDHGYRPRYQEPTPQPTPPPVKSETELMVEGAQRRLFETALQRALEPPKPAEPVNPISQLSAEDQLAFGLLKQGNTLQTVIEKIATITQQPDRIDPTPGWKDKLADAGIQLVTQNPQIIAQATDIVTRAATALLGAFAPRNNQIINEPIPVTPQPVRRPPIQRAQATIPAQAVAGLPETNQPEDDPFDDDDPELIMLEEITKLLLSEEPLSLNDPVILDLRAEFPQHFDTALAAIATAPSLMVIQYICKKSEFAKQMFNSNVTGPHLRKRLEELKQLIKLPPETTAQIQQAISNNDDTQTFTEETENDETDNVPTL